MFYVQPRENCQNHLNKASINNDDHAYTYIIVHREKKITSFHHIVCHEHKRYVFYFQPLKNCQNHLSVAVITSDLGTAPGRADSGETLVMCAGSDLA